MKIKFRDANPNELEGQLDFSWIGFGGILEGPVSSKSAAFLAIKRSYLKYLIDNVDIGTSSAPEYGDIQGKFTYEFNPFQKITALVVFADDHNSPDRENAKENAMTHYGSQDLYQGTYGVNWRAVWNESTFSNTSLALTTSRFDENFRETYKEPPAEIPDIRNNSTEYVWKMRNINFQRLGESLSLEFGIDAKYLLNSYDNYLAATANSLGDTIPELTMKARISASYLAAFTNLNFKPLSKIFTTLGLRADYFSLTDFIALSPRFSCQYELSEKTSLNFSSGFYRQNLPLILLAQNKSNRRLKTPLAVHFIIGLQHLLTEDTRLTVEAYQKNYRNFPVDPQQPGLFIIDENYFQNFENLGDSGKAFSKGIEITLQKKLAESIYGLASATYFRSRYKSLDGVWRNRNYDNRLIISLEGGYKPSSGWEMSMRWIYAGGVPYTPIDATLSDLYNQTVHDDSQINAKRYPAYHSLNLRLDKRFYFNSTNLVIYFSVWNAYSRKNIAEYYWNDEKQKIDKIYQWTLLPILGVEYEF